MSVAENRRRPSQHGADGRRRGPRAALAPVLPSGPDGLDLVVTGHLLAAGQALTSLQAAAPLLARWGATLADRLLAGHRVLAAGNGGSAAEAQHFTAELVGRFDGEREPFSALSLHSESSAVTAIANDYGFAEVFARQVRAHGRPGDVLVVFSTSGRSENVILAVRAARECGMTSWALTGAGPNPLAAVADDALTVDGPAASAQECHLIAVHAICRAFDARVAGLRAGFAVQEAGA